MIGTSMLK